MNGIITFAIGTIVGVILAAVFGLTKKRLGAVDIVSRQMKEKEENKKRIVEFMRGKDRITNDEVERFLGVSNATAERYLDELEKEGILKQVGRTGKHVYYRHV